MTERAVELKATIKKFQRTSLDFVSGEFDYRGSRYRLYDEYLEGPNAVKALYNVREYAGKHFLYRHRVDDRVVAWALSLLFIEVNVLHNIFVKCIYALVLYAYSFGKDDGARFMVKAGAPYRAIVATIPQLCINTLSFLFFGLYSSWCNRISGDIERWALGDGEKEVAEISLPKRCRLKWYLAPCQQPIAVLKSDTIRDSLTLQQAVSVHAFRFLIPSMLEGGRPARSIPERSCKFL